MIIQNGKTDRNSISDLSAGCEADLRRSEGWPIKKVIKTARCGELGHVPIRSAILTCFGLEPFSVTSWTILPSTALGRNR
jgi:hypothetical protein